MKAVRWIGRARGSVRLRVTLLAAGLFAVTLFGAAVLLLYRLEHSLIEDQRAADTAALRARARVLLVDGLPANATYVPAPGAMVVSLPPQGGTAGTVIAASDPLAFQQLVTGQPNGGSALTVSQQTFDQQAPKLLGVAAMQGDYIVSRVEYGGLLLATASPLDTIRESISTTRHLLWFVGPGLVALVAGLAWLVTGRALRPVHAVTSQVAAIGGDSLHERVPVPPSGDEIAELARTMNSMLARLEVASATSRRLVSDASHELRTPVSVMRTEMEVARQSDSPDWDATSAVVLDELSRLQQLVDDLLLLARGDERAFAARPVSLADAVHEVAARRRSLPVEVAIGDGDLRVLGDQASLRRAIDHLVANAARHGRQRVTLGAARQDGEIVVQVDDDGPGIPRENREEVVRRFVRLDEGRGRDAGGAGLGLALASEVAAAHGGRLEIADSPLGGARLALHLPVLDS